MMKMREKYIRRHDAAKVRLHQWARAVRADKLRDCPDWVPYRSQPFTHERIDWDRLRANIEFMEEDEKVIEVENYLADMETSSPSMYGAIYIKYVRGGGKNGLNSKRQVAMWKRTTRLSRTTYFDRIGEGERYIANRLAVTAGFRSEVA